MTALIELTVIGGYLGSGKTTVVNHLLRHPHGRRLAVIVNDFGQLGIDAELLADATGDDGIVSLPNGCVCCTLGTGLMDALTSLASLDPRPDQVVVEASGVADPAPVAAWGYTAPFAPGGVVVVAAADEIRRQVDDRLIGTTIRRQLSAADLVLLSKGDLVGPDAVDEVVRWLAAIEPVPVVAAANGHVDPDVVLGVRPDGPEPPPPRADEHSHYRTSSWQQDSPVPTERLDAFLAELDPRVLRLKGWVATSDGPTMSVQVVGRRRIARPIDRPGRRSSLVAIWLEGALDDLWAPLEG